MRRVFQKSCECRIPQAHDRETGREWVLQQDFKASSSGACTAMRWRPHTASLPAMILLGTEHGAKVQQSSLYGCHTLGCLNPCRIKAVSGSLLNYSSIEALFCMLCAVCCLLSAAQEASLHAMIPQASQGTSRDRSKPSLEAPCSPCSVMGGLETLRGCIRHLPVRL